MFPFSAWIPNGAQPAGIFGSWKGNGSGLNEASNESTLALWKSVAYSWSFNVARPSNTAPLEESSTPVTALVLLTVGAQPMICPACVANRKRAGELAPFWVTTKSVVLAFATVPVGPPATVTVSALFEPTPE